MNRQRILIFCLSAVTWLSSSAAAQDPGLTQAISQVAAVKNGGYGHEQAIVGWKVLGAAGVEQVPAILAAIRTDKPLAANWLRSAVDQILERHVATGQELPKDTLEKIVFDQSYAPRARRMAYEWLLTVDKTAAKRIIPKMLNDSSLEMRRDAVALAISEAQQLAEGPEAIKQYKRALTAARDFDQVEAIEKSLNDLGEKVDLQQHFGFLVDWKLIGPFDNTDKGGFDVEYGPEEFFASKPGYQGKANAEVSWSEHSSDHKYGEVDLNEAIGKHMGAVGYAYTVFHSKKPQQVDFRVVSQNANKLWVNGKQIMANEVYHAGGQFDQYKARANLKPGKNHVLVKVCQNEQTEAWAQSWKFQLRVCDSLGTAVRQSSAP